jgi:hypothetical protein
MLLANVFFNQRSNTGVLCCAAVGECFLLAWFGPERLELATSGQVE